ncbi:MULTISPECIES: hypothetical protein [Frankia]|uniref:Uncharacterized protein n=1 Tax=Frankia alni (strain DSM 45986 / CECT 9034 / ACN14a) TaxID=326424 RepID=Q0RFE7_FRAAA|nr:MULTISPECIES: hypothetical protein [Frankia]CAJ63798.1 hypothetical protein FRAAL5158 [Frankia alni ACN14a]
MLRSLLSVLEEATLLVLPHGGQKTARRNAWRAAADLHVTSGYRWVDPVALAPIVPRPEACASIPGAESGARAPRLAGLGSAATTARLGAAVRGLPRIVAVQS